MRRPNKHHFIKTGFGVGFMTFVGLMALWRPADVSAIEPNFNPINPNIELSSFGTNILAASVFLDSLMAPVLYLMGFVVLCGLAIFYFGREIEIEPDSNDLVS